MKWYEKIRIVLPYVWFLSFILISSALRERIINYLVTNMSNELCLQSFFYGVGINEDRILEKSVAYISGNFDTIYKTDSFFVLTMDELQILIKRQQGRVSTEHKANLVPM